MHYVNTSCTILFESPYWIGIFEKTDGKGYSVSRFVFGKEPTGPELYNFMIKYYPKQLSYSKPNEEMEKSLTRTKINPKRRQREAAKAMQEKSISTKAQEALRLQYEENKKQRKTASKAKKLERERKKFELKQQKKKEKKKGH
ncbi:MAG: YjdF family protein [Maledivibacter sp.]|jgi:hypothetical protein|nr:YjdF family protein [Maledivibacter sp.]